MIHIRNSGDLKIVYEILWEMQELIPLPGREEAAQEHIWELKKGYPRIFQETGESRNTACYQ